MLYSPPTSSVGLWDTWLLQVGNDIHLFHLQRDIHEVGCSVIGHAVSTDWLHWETLPPVVSKGFSGEWDDGPLMTGMTLQFENQYYLFYGAMVDRVQRIGLAISDDLVHWKKLPEPVLEADGPYYETDPRQAINYETAWRDPYIFFHQPDKCFYAFICARMANMTTDVGGGCVAVAKSTNLTNWELLPPAFVSDSLTCLEVPEYFSLNGRHYLTYTSSYHFGTAYPVYDSHNTTGSFYLISDTPLSGYRLPDGDNTLNACAPQTLTNYVGRSIPDKSSSKRRHFYFHNVFPHKVGESVYGSLNAVKYLEEVAPYELKVRYSPLLEAHTEPIDQHENPLSSEALLYVVDEAVINGIIEATITHSYAGIGFRMARQREGNLEGLAIWISPYQQDSDDYVVMLGSVHMFVGPNGIRPALGGPLALRRVTINPATPNHLRVVFREAFVDVYVNDNLCISHTFPPEQASNQNSVVGAFYVGQPKDNAVSDLVVRRFKGI